MLHKWKFIDDTSSPSSAEQQTMTHIMEECSFTAFDDDISTINNLHPDAIEWLKKLNL
jgi:hypothetical protein